MMRLWLLLLAAPLVVGCMSFHKGALPGEPRDASYVELPGARVRYVDRGKGPPVVLLHGFAASLDTWKDVGKELSKTHRVVALDLKGFGWTDRPEGDYSPAAQAQLVLSLLDHLGIRETAVVAHSWGASVALALGLAAPKRVTKLALYDAWVFEEQLPTTFLWARADGLGEILFGLYYDERPDEKMALAFFDENNVSEELVESVEDALDRPGATAAALAAVRGQRYEEVQDRYASIQVPVLLLWGREDRVTTLPFGERLASQLPNARLVVYPRCGHFPMIEAKAASTAELVRFLAEPAPAEPATPAPEPAPEPTAEPAAEPSPAPSPTPSPADDPTREPEPATPYDGTPQ